MVIIVKAKVRLREYKHIPIKISGAKNSSLPIIAASILCDEVVTLENVPIIKDVLILVNILKDIGYKLDFDKENNKMKIYPCNIKRKHFYNNKINKLRGSYYLMGALIGKNDFVNFSFLYPGGCNLGERPINYHLNAFSNMGLKITTNRKSIHIKGYKKSITHNLLYPSVGTTINILLASCKLNETTIINNASIEPEVIDVCNFLKSMGVNITINNRCICMTGNSYLKQTNYKIMEDRIEAGTYLILGALHNGITITNINPLNLDYLTNLLGKIGYTLQITNDTITLNSFNKKNIKPFNIILEPHPGFPTDLGPLLCVLASQINGTSIITETVFKDRFNHIEELKKMNIDISLDINKIIIKGISEVINSTIKATDLRCAASLLLASSINSNFSTIEDIDYLFRGYEDIKEKLDSLGIDFIV